MLYEAAGGFLSGEKTGGNISLPHAEKWETPTKLRFPHARKETGLLAQSQNPECFLLNYFFEPGSANAPRLFFRHPLWINDNVLKYCIFKVKCQNREGVCVIYIYTYRE